MKLDKTSAIHIRKGLLPLSIIYGLGVKCRNFMFSTKMLKRHSFDIPIFCIGNIAVGGTGKTPHSEFVIEVLVNAGYKVALLSRGYKRKTKGFLLASENSSVLDIGDEPFQIKQKYPQIYVAVDENRVNGIERLLKLDTPPDVIIMDDGLQHRYVIASYNILLTSYDRPYFKDELLPAGRLREKMTIKESISDFFITKCPNDLKPLELRLFEHQIDPYPYQDVFFTNLNYQALTAVFSNKTIEVSQLKDKHILLVAGIANPLVLINQLKQYTNLPVKSFTFPDHYQFTKVDIAQILEKYNKIEGDKVLLFTEKDATRLLHLNHLDPIIVEDSYSIPIKINFMLENQEELFRNKILNHVRTYTKDC